MNGLGEELLFREELHFRRMIEGYMRIGYPEAVSLFIGKAECGYFLSHCNLENLLLACENHQTVPEMRRFMESLLCLIDNANVKGKVVEKFYEILYKSGHLAVAFDLLQHTRSAWAPSSTDKSRLDRFKLHFCHISLRLGQWNQSVNGDVYDKYSSKCMSRY